MNYLTMSHADLVEELQRRDAGLQRTFTEQSVHDSKIADVLKINAEYPGVIKDATGTNPAVVRNPVNYPSQPLGYVSPNPPVTIPNNPPNLPGIPVVKGPPNPPNVPNPPIVPQPNNPIK